MSHLWRSQLFVLLGVDRLSLQYQSAFFSRHQSAQMTISFEATPENLWQSAVQQLDAALTELKQVGQADLNLVLSSEFVRYLILPPQGIAANAVESKAYAQAFFNDIYGDTAQTWQIAVDDTAPHMPSLAVAIEGAFYKQLNLIVDKHHLTLKRFEPFVTTAVNLLDKEIGNTSGYLAIVELHRVLLLRLRKGKLMHLKVDVIRNYWQQTLTQLVMRKDALNLDEFCTDSTQETINEVVLLFTPFISGGFNGKVGELEIKSVGLQRNAQSNQFLAMLQTTNSVV